MLLAIDIGNSNISVGLFDKAGKLLFLSSIDTDSRKTADQISIDLMNLFALYRYDLKDVTGAIFSSVVPPINFMMTKALTRLLGNLELYMYRHRGVLAYSTEEVDVNGGGVVVRIRGEGLQLLVMTEQELRLTGKIAGIELVE